MKTFGEYVREKRKTAKLTAGAVARRLGLNMQYLCKIEADKTPPPSPRVIARLARILKADAEVLLLMAYARKAPKPISATVGRLFRAEIDQRIAAAN